MNNNKKIMIMFAFMIIGIANLLQTASAEENSGNTANSKEEKSRVEQERVMVGGYTGTMGNGPRLTFYPGVDQYAPFSITMVKRVVDVQDVEGTALEGKRNVLQFSYEPGMKFDEMELSGAWRIRPRIDIPIGISTGWNDYAANKALAFQRGPTPGTGEWVIVDIPMSIEYQGTSAAIFAGAQVSLDLYPVNSRFHMSFSVRETAGVSLTGAFNEERGERNDVNGIGAHIMFGYKF